MNELYNETKNVVVECWSNRKSSYFMNMLQIVLVIFFAVLALPVVSLLKDRVDYAACVYLGAFIWVIIFKFTQHVFV